MPQPISSKTGNAPIKYQGYTSSGKNGSNPDAQPKGYPSEPRKLTVK